MAKEQGLKLDFKNPYVVGGTIVVIAGGLYLATRQQKQSTADTEVVETAKAVSLVPMPTAQEQPATQPATQETIGLGSLQTALENLQSQYERSLSEQTKKLEELYQRQPAVETVKEAKTVVKQTRELFPEIEQRRKILASRRQALRELAQKRAEEILAIKRGQKKPKKAKVWRIIFEPGKGYTVG